jgi:hypothetical protein
MKAKKTIIQLRSQYIQTKDAFIKNYINIELANLATLERKSEGAAIDIDEVLVSIAQVLRLSILPDKYLISVTQFKALYEYTKNDIGFACFSDKLRPRVMYGAYPITTDKEYIIVGDDENVRFSAVAIY